MGWLDDLRARVGGGREGRESLVDKFQRTTTTGAGGTDGQTTAQATGGVNPGGVKAVDSKPPGASTGKLTKQNAQAFCDKNPKLDMCK